MARRHPENTGGRAADVSRPDPVTAKAAAIKAVQAHPPTWQTIIKRAVVLAITGLAIYLVLPSLIAVSGSWPRLSALSPLWFTVALAAELVSFTCNFGVQRLAMARSGKPGLVGTGVDQGSAPVDLERFPGRAECPLGP